MIDKLKPGDTIGILGGGQLARMLCHSASQLGLRTIVYCPDEHAPAFETATHFIHAPYDSGSDMLNFDTQCQVITYEFENLPLKDIELSLRCNKIRPGIESLRISQDRLIEKWHLEKLDIPVVPYASIDSYDDIKDANIDYPAIIKTRTMGYDGKSQIHVNDYNEAELAWNDLNNVPCIIEQKIDFIAECSCIATRQHNGMVTKCDVAENIHEDGILRKSIVPAPSVTDALQQEIDFYITRLIGYLNHVGTLALEMFVVKGKDNEFIIVNEIAPRVHNSGHYTMNGCSISQFELHMRAISGHDQPVFKRFCDIEMENLIGDEVKQYEKIMAEPNAFLHLYGKHQILPGRKMGHVNRLITPPQT